MAVYTFENVHEAIRRYVEALVPAAVGMGAVPEIGVEVADRGRVKSGRMTSAVRASAGTATTGGDPGQAPGDPDSYPPRHFHVPARSELELPQLRFKQPAWVVDNVSYASVWASRDPWILDAIAAVGDRWPAVAEDGVRRAKVRP